MKFNKWTMGLAAVGVVSLASVARADEKVSQLNTALSSTTLSGYVDVGVQYSTAKVLTYGPEAVTQDGFSLNVVDIALDKPLDATPFSAGYHIELWTGPGNAIVTGSSLVRQAYLALGTTVAGQEIDWKIGVFDTPIGYEVLTSGSNPNYTHSYGFFVEPTTHTGVLGSYKVNDEISIQAGIADNEGGNSAAVNGIAAPTTGFALGSPQLLALVSLTAPDSWGAMKGATLSVGTTYNTDDNGSKNVYAGATIPTPLTGLKVGLAYDYVDQLDVTGAIPPASPVGGYVNVFGAYGTWTSSDSKVSLSLRGEYAHQSTAAVGTLFASTDGEEFTATASYALWANVLSRVEVRLDHSSGASYAEGGNLVQNSVFLGAQLIYTF